MTCFPRLVACCFLILSAVGVSFASAAEAQPNILWITCEDISPHLGCYGDEQAITPNIDRLATQGVRYTNAFSTSGVCAPSRSSIISGMYQTSLGSMHMRCQAKLPEGFRCFPSYLREAGYYCTNNSKTDYNFATPKGTWDESSGKAHWRKRPQADQPFFAVFNFTTSHEGHVVSDSVYESAVKKLPPELLRDGSELTLPPYYPDTPGARQEWARLYNVITAMDRQVGAVLEQLEEDGLADNTIVFYYSDHGDGLPRRKRWLYDSGLQVPMIVRIPESLRLGGQARPGTTDDQLVSFVDLAPTVLNLAGIEPPERFAGRAFLGGNLTSPRDYIYGVRDRMDERYDIIRAVRDQRYKYLRNYEPFKPYYQYMNTAEQCLTMHDLRRLHAEGELSPVAELFMAETKPVEELYDLQEDPHEIHNLADSPQHQEVLQRLRAAHEAWQRDTKDLGLVPEPELIAREEQLGSRYAILRQPGGDALTVRLREVASMAGRGDSADIPALTSALADEDAAVRYWAAVGLGNQPQLAEGATGRLTEMLDDSSAVVRIAAARALARMSPSQPAFDCLAAELQSDQEWTRLHAVLVLDELDEQARPAITLLQQAMKDKQNKYVVRVANRALNQLLGTSNEVP